MTSKPRIERESPGLRGGRSRVRRWRFVLLASLAAILLIEGARRALRSIRDGGFHAAPSAVGTTAVPEILVLDPLELAAVPEASEFWVSRAGSLRGVFIGAPALVVVRPLDPPGDFGEARKGMLAHRSSEGGWYASWIDFPDPGAPRIGVGEQVSPGRLGAIGSGFRAGGDWTPASVIPGSIVAGFPAGGGPSEFAVRLRDPLDEPPAFLPGDHGPAGDDDQATHPALEPGVEIEFDLEPPNGEAADGG